MFKLVGRELFSVGESKAVINIEAVGGFSYEYSLNVDGKSLDKFIQNRAKTTQTWILKVDGLDYRLVLGTTKTPQKTILYSFISVLIIFNVTLCMSEG